MKDGFIKVAAATPKIRVNDTDFNKNSITEQIFDAEGNGAKIVVFPELCITGYTCKDLFLQSSTVKRAENALVDILKKTKKLDILFAVGLPFLYNDKLYNVAAICHAGKVLGLVPKTNLPDYSEFDEGRYFTKPTKTHTVLFGGEEVPFGTKLIFCSSEIGELKIACELCEDMWVAAPPSISHTLNGATVILNLSANNESIGKAEGRRMHIKSHSARCVSAYIYADAGDGESTTDFVYSGHNIIGECGKILKESELFENGIIYSVVDVQKISQMRRKTSTFRIADDDEYQRIFFDMKICNTKLDRINPTPFVPSEKNVSERCEMVLKMQVKGLKKRIEHIGLKSVVLGISGGLDSTLALLVAARTFDELGLDRKGIISVTMPCFGTTDRTYQNAKKLSKLLGVDLREINIKDSVTLHLKDIGASLDDHDVAYENAQARERTQVLMDIANKTGGIVIGTGDLSESALGFATYNGDHMSMYGVNCSVPKTLMRYLVRYAADLYGGELGEILRDVVETPVSPELLPPEESGNIKQKTEDIVGPYELHDFFLYNMVRFGFSKSKIQRMAEKAFEGVFDSEVIAKWLGIFIKRFYTSQFKRSAMPDGPKVGTVSLSPRGDWKMPSDAVFEE